MALTEYNLEKISWLLFWLLQLSEQYILRNWGTFIDCVTNCRFCLWLGVKYWEWWGVSSFYKSNILEFVNMKITIYLPNGQKSKKIKALSFLELLKFKEAKCLYCFDLRPFGWDMAIFLFIKTTDRLDWFKISHKLCKLMKLMLKRPLY